MNENLISATLSSEDTTAIEGAITTLQQRLRFLKGLDAETRRGLPRMGDKSRAFVHKCVEVAIQNVGILPRAFDLEEYKRDVALEGQLLPIAESIRHLSELIDDTLIAVRSDAYLASLVVYQAAKYAGKGTGLDGAVDELGRRFGRKAGSVAPVPQPISK